MARALPASRSGLGDPVTEFMLVGGAGEKLTVDQVAGRLIRPLLSANDRMTVVRYDNSIGPVNSTPKLDWGLPLMEAVNHGKTAVKQAVRATQDVPWLVGYSLGAYGVSEFLEEKTAGMHKELQIRGAILIGSPRAYRRGMVEGIAGPHGKYPSGVPVVEVCNYDDVICSTTVDSVLQKLPGLVNILTGARLSSNQLFEVFTRLLAENNRIPSLRDVKLISKYANGSGHVEEYFTKPEFRRQIGRALGVLH